MPYFFPVFLVIALSWTAFGQIANRATLTLVDEAGFNEVDIDLDVDLIGASNDTSELSGTIEVQLNISPALGTTDELTILSADVAGSDITLARGGFFTNYSLMGQGLGFTAITTEAPGTVEPTTGEFDAAQHDVTVSEGTLEGSAYTLITGTEAVEFDFATDNVTGAGSGTGTITVVPLRIEGRKMIFEVTVVLPLSLAETTVLEGSTVEVSTEIAGTMKAKGESFIELEDYASWASGEGLETTSEDDFGLSLETPNYMFFALGHDRSSAPQQAFEFSQSGVTLTVGAEVALGDLEIQWSSDLTSWSRVPTSEMASGDSVILLGDSLLEPIIVSRDEEKKFFRLARIATD